MNSKKAKALRKLTKQFASEHGDKVSHNVQYLENVNKRSTQTIEDLKDGELVSEEVIIANGPITIDPATERGIYHFLKKAYA